MKFFKYKYEIKHDHFIPSIGKVTNKKVEALANKSGRYRQSVKKNFDDWVMKKDEKVDIDFDSSFNSVHKSFLNLKKGKKRRVIRCSNCLQLYHNKQTCENDPASPEIKEDFKLTKAAKKKRNLAYKIRRRQISKDWYRRHQDQQKLKKKLYMRRQRKEKRKQE